MVNQHSHTIRVYPQGALSYNSDGDPIPATEGEPKTYTCRAENMAAVFGGTNAIKAVTDGVRLDYTYTVYLPSGTPFLPIGARVELYQGAVRIAEDTIKSCVVNHFNTVVWL